MKTSKNKRTAAAVVIKPAAKFKEHQESNCPICSWTKWTSPMKKRQAGEAIFNVVNVPKSPKLVAEHELNETSELQLTSTPKANQSITRSSSFNKTLFNQSNDDSFSKLGTSPKKCHIHSGELMKG